LVKRSPATVESVGHGGGTPTGSVTFYDGTTVLGDRKLKGGKAKLSTASLLVGRNEIWVKYMAIGAFEDTQSRILNEKVLTGHSKSLLAPSVIIIQPSESPTP
jgi:Bacterial Ig-like domain (group 3)